MAVGTHKRRRDGSRATTLRIRHTTTTRETSMPTIELQICSPRWGHDDTYAIELERDYIEITTRASTQRRQRLGVS